MNAKITNTAQLKEAIALMENEAAVKRSIAIDHFHNTYESLKPVNLIKQVFNIKEVADNVIDTSIGRGAGILSKKILVGKSSNILKRIFGTIIELSVANAVSKNADGIKGKAFELIKKLIK